MLGSHLDDPVKLLVLIALFIVSISLHELGHALTATALGDPTARDAGRVTLNPMAHLDPFGTLFILFAGFGWAKPVPVNPGLMRWPRLGNFLVSAAGPGTNFLLALGALLAIKYWETMPPGSALWFQTAFGLNLMLMVFNLLPIPPLDGGHLLEAVLPRRWLPTYEHLLPYGVVVLLVLVLVPSQYNPLGWLYRSAAEMMFRLVALG